MAGGSSAIVDTAHPPSHAAPSEPAPTEPGLSPVPSSPPAVATPTPRLPGGLLIADRGNGRLLVVSNAGRVVWRFPVAGSLPPHQRFSADDAFVAPDGKTIVANDESHQVIDRIDIATRRVIWQYGRYDRPGLARGSLHTPDDAYPLANGDVVVADIRNCRILEISPAKRIVHQWGRTGVCRHRPPTTFAMPNGDTPLPDGGLLITEITGSRIVRLRADGSVAFDIRAPVRYPSDAQLAPDGSIIVVDYSRPGAVVRLSRTGRVLWRYQPAHGPRALDHPSLAVPLPDGTIVLNDDLRHRVLVIDPRTNRIVWQFGRTDHPGRSLDHLDVPDGVDVVPIGVIGTAIAGG
jgi:outer membrane protein assembly factor BamB